MGAAKTRCSEEESEKIPETRSKAWVGEEAVYRCETDRAAVEIISFFRCFERWIPRRRGLDEGYTPRIRHIYVIYMGGIQRGWPVLLIPSHPPTPTPMPDLRGARFCIY